MWSKKLYPILVCLTVVAFLTIIGCEGPEGPQGPQGPEGSQGAQGSPGETPITIIGSVEIDHYGEPEGDVFVNVFGCTGFPNVEVNGWWIPHHFNWYGSSFVYWDMPIAPGDSANLVVTYPIPDSEFGQATAGILLPNPSEVISPTPDTVDIGDSLTVYWTTPGGADFYWIDFTFHYYYTDTSGTPDIEFRYTVDTTVIGTSITFTSSQLFPNLEAINIVEGGGCLFKIYSVNGPIQGEQGNIVGDGEGIFHGWTFSPDYHIYINNVVPSPIFRSTKHPARIYMKRFEGIYN